MIIFQRIEVEKWFNSYYTGADISSVTWATVALCVSTRGLVVVAKRAWKCRTLQAEYCRALVLAAPAWFDSWVKLRLPVFCCWAIVSDVCCCADVVLFCGEVDVSLVASSCYFDNQNSC